MMNGGREGREVETDGGGGSGWAIVIHGCGIIVSHVH